MYFKRNYSANHRLQSIASLRLIRDVRLNRDMKHILANILLVGSMLFTLLFSYLAGWGWWSHVTESNEEAIILAFVSFHIALGASLITCLVALFSRHQPRVLRRSIYIFTALLIGIFIYFWFWD